jgi:hypothetical protein
MNSWAPGIAGSCRTVSTIAVSMSDPARVEKAEVIDDDFAWQHEELLLA